jgi:hypothetical protein
MASPAAHKCSSVPIGAFYPPSFALFPFAYFIKCYGLATTVSNLVPYYGNKILLSLVMTLLLYSLVAIGWFARDLPDGRKTSNLPKLTSKFADGNDGKQSDRKAIMNKSVKKIAFKKVMNWKLEAR